MFLRRVDTAARLTPQDVNAAGSSAPPKMQRFEASKKTVGLAGGRKLLSDFRISGGLRGFCVGVGKWLKLRGRFILADGEWLPRQFELNRNTLSSMELLTANARSVPQRYMALIRSDLR